MDYALSKDLDVALWQQYLLFKGKPPLTDAGDFVIVDSKLHDEFDAFKKEYTKSKHAFVPVNELLYFYASFHVGDDPKFQVITKFDKDYYELHSSQIDEFILWVLDMRKRYKGSEGENIFKIGPQNLPTEETSILLLVYFNNVIFTMYVGVKMLASKSQKRPIEDDSNELV